MNDVTRNVGKEGPGRLSEGLERFAVALLIASNSEVNQKWLDGTPQELQEAIDALHLTDKPKEALKLFLSDNDHNLAVKGVFRITAQLLKLLYTGDPCPDRQQSADIVAALKK